MGTETTSPVAPGLFVTGTDTGVGKTHITCALMHALAAQGHKVVGMKPVAAGAAWASGAWVNDDVEALMAAANVVAPREQVNPYCYTSPIAPHIAAMESGNSIEINKLIECYQALTLSADAVLVEGAGGLLVPLDERRSFADFAAALRLPVVLVVGMRLGCLNHALLTVEAIAARGLRLVGWVANHIDRSMPRASENVAALQMRIAAPMLARVPYGATPQQAARTFDLKLLN